MVDLTSLEEIKKRDPKNVFGSTEMLPLQCEQIYGEIRALDFPKEYRNLKNIVLCGMGGSAYGGYVANALYKEELSAPLYSNNDYTLPAFVNEDTLVILSSYSGTTEEVLACAEEALKKGAKITGIASGGVLKGFFTKNSLPGIIFSPSNNPSGQPRLGTGYMVLGILTLLSALGYISMKDNEVQGAISAMKQNAESIKQKARQLAQMLSGNIPVYFAAEFLNGNIHILRNQTNETAKSFASFSELSELNHHLMEGLKNPPDKKLIIVFISSPLYSDKLQKRLELTKDVVEKNNVSWVEFVSQSYTKMGQVLEVLSFGGYLTFYLALIYGQEPSVIPWVDYFKEQLAK